MLNGFQPSAVLQSIKRDLSRRRYGERKAGVSAHSLWPSGSVDPPHLDRGAWEMDCGARACLGRIRKVEFNSRPYALPTNRKSLEVPLIRTN